jgi:hypothetical protein
MKVQIMPAAATPVLFHCCACGRDSSSAEVCGWCGTLLPPGTHGQHTPGPWQLARADAERCRVVIETLARGNDLPDQGYELAVAYWGTPSEEANARLMAAAPDLLVALKMCAQAIRDAQANMDAAEIDEHWQDQQLRDAEIKARAAVARAERGQP